MPFAAVTYNVVNMHAKPDGASEQVSQAILGHTVYLVPRVRHREGWLKIATDDDYPGWVRSSQIRVLPEMQHYPARGCAYRVNAVWCRVHEAPAEDSYHITLAPIGAWLEGHEWYGDWLRVCLPDEREGWVSAQDVTPRWVQLTQLGTLRVQGVEYSLGNPASEYRIPRTSWQNALVHVAKRFVGVPYLWGGSSPFGLDCSGFVQLVYRLCGLIIPRDADLQAQYERCQKVELLEAQPGDLIFFAGGSDPHRRTISHVGMVIDREHFIHSSGGVGVNISRIDNPYYTSILWGVRRVLDPQPNERQ